MTGLKPVSFKKGREHAPRLSQPYVPGRTHQRFWTAAEDEVLREHYAIGGVTACQPRLPSHHQTATLIYQRAHKLGLRSEKPIGGSKEHNWEQEAPADLDDRIREAWSSLTAKGAVARFADELGLPRWVVSKRATKLGLTKPHKKEPPWTEAENQLMRKVPLHDPSRAAEIFRQHGFVRTASAIVVKAKRLSLSRRTCETLSGRGAARILGVDDKWITVRCISGELKASRRGSQRLPQQGGDAWAIEPADLRAYVVEHLDQVDIRKVEKFAFVNLLTSAPGPSGDA